LDWSILCYFCWNTFCVPIIIETCFSIFKLHLTWLTYSIEDGHTFLYLKSECKIYQVVNSYWIKRCFSFLWHLNIGIKLKLVRLVLNQQRQKLLNAIPKGFYDYVFPKKMKQRFVCCLTKATKIWFWKFNFK